MAGNFPRVIHDHRHIAQAVRRNFGQRLSVLSSGLERATAESGRLACQRVGAVRNFAGHVEIKFVRTARLGGPAPVHPELLAVPTARSNVGNLRCPYAVRATLPTRDAPATIKDRSCSSRRLEAHPAVVGRQREWRIDRILAGLDEHECGLAIVAFRAQFANSRYSPSETGHRAIGPGRVGGRQRAGPGIVAGGRDMPGHRIRGPRGRSHRKTGGDESGSDLNSHGDPQTQRVDGDEALVGLVAARSMRFGNSPKS